MNLRIKICGITSVADALEAANAGADAIGFMLYPKSKRYVTPEQAAEISRALPPFVARVGVFVNETEENIHHLIDFCQLDSVQLHGEESPEFCDGIPGKTIKAFRLRSQDDLTTMQPYRTDAWLLDSYSPSAHGGTGDSFNWTWVAESRPYARPVIIAGGLTPDNAADCVLATRPFGLDVSSGVESAPGKKDPARIKAFIAAARKAADQVSEEPEI